MVQETVHSGGAGIMGSGGAGVVGGSGMAGGTDAAPPDNRACPALLGVHGCSRAGEHGVVYGDSAVFCYGRPH